MAKIKTMFEDENKTQAIYPRTVASAVAMSDGTALDNKLNQMDDDTYYVYETAINGLYYQNSESISIPDIDLSGEPVEDDMEMIMSSMYPACVLFDACIINLDLPKSMKNVTPTIDSITGTFLSYNGAGFTFSMDTHAVTCIKLTDNRIAIGIHALDDTPLASQTLEPGVMAAFAVQITFY